MKKRLSVNQYLYMYVIFLSFLQDLILEFDCVNVFKCKSTLSIYPKQGS